MKKPFTKFLLIFCTVLFFFSLQIVLAQNTKNENYEKLINDRKDQEDLLKVPSTEFSDPFIIITFGILNHESEMGRLDLFAQRIAENPKFTAFIVGYGGRSNKFGEFDLRTDRIKNYLLNKKKLDPTRIKFVHGGFRETFEFDLWLSPAEKSFPPLSPSISPEKVKFKGKMTSIETCCNSL